MRPNAFLIAVLAALAAVASPAFAFLNVTSNYVNLSSQSDIGSNVTMLNLSLSLSDIADVNITGINFTFGSTNASINANETNLSVCVYNNSINQTNFLGCNGTWNGSVTTVPVGITISNAANITLIVAYDVNRSVIQPMNVSLNISSNSSVILNDTSILVNSSLVPQFPISSNYTDVRTVRAWAEISPHFVDTNVTNQTIKYFVSSITGDPFNRTIITLPGGFSLVGVELLLINRSGGGDTNHSFCPPTYCSLSGNKITINDSAGMQNITLYFIVNTNSSNLSSMQFNSTIDGTNVNNITTEHSSDGINVTTKPMLNITNIAIIKNTAIVNGTDYWEFNLTLNVSEAITGTAHFKLADWNSTAASSAISLTNGTEYYATLRNNTELFYTEDAVNLTNSYNMAHGVFINSTASSTVNLILRMVIPIGTPIASDWWTTYSIIMKTLP